LLAVPGPAGLLACAAGVQLRLLCNLLDGMVAIEGGKQSPLGGLYNELPDRLADAVLLVALGYAAAVPWLGWLCALLAVLTAYIRAFGAGGGLAHDFSGPMAKPQRMAAMTAGCVAAAVEGALHGSRHSLLIAAAVIAAGTALTCLRRTATLAARLQGASGVSPRSSDIR